MEYLRQHTEREWSAKSARSLLTSPVFAGELHWGDHVNPTAHAPLVPRALWEEAQGILSHLETMASARQSGKRGTVTYNRSAHGEEEYLLRGLVRCNHCGSLMSASWATGKAGKVLYYECAHARAYKSSGCPVRRVNATSLESTLLEEIFRTIAHPARMRKWMEAAAEQLTAGRAEELEDEQRRVRRNLQEAKRKITNLVAAIKAAAIAPDALPPLVEALGEQEKQRERLEARIAQLTTSLRSSRRRISASVACRAWADLPETWELATPEEQRTIVASLVDRIDLTGRDGETKEIQGTFSLIIDYRSFNAG
ncbi:MAG: recombinase zinc beta ribbon domain-containing protein [Armatimonadetes bacterium]|nr:recombinase zinc beta ribbon domain-containing protein [Armatimonadota bacterium]